ncbi:fungal-specific transcription factor domain-containing protein [Fusarium avenaceum]|nr:fungal-specific transcription factor domain-containing protein [Fusarium avenaceum]
MTACLRCRQKKRRCDQQRPTCRLCKLAGVECVDYDSEAGRQVSRSYVPQLESRIQYLERRLRENGIHIDGDDTQTLSTTVCSTSQITPPVTNHESPSSLPQTDTALSEARGLVSVEAHTTPTDSGNCDSFTKVLLIELISPAGHSSASQNRSSALSGTSATQDIDLSRDLDTGNITLPPKNIAETLVKAYFQLNDVAMPLLHQPSFRQQFDLVYQMSHTINFTRTHSDTHSRVAVFFVLEVLAIALLGMQKQDPSSVSTCLTDRYHRTALEALGLISVSSDVQGVQALLLVAQYSYLHPNFWAAWRTVGAALRLAAELGLHQDMTNGFDALALDTRRRTFWVAYSMDRNLSIAMSLPFGLSDGAISSLFPSEIADDLITTNGIGSNPPCVTKELAQQMFRYRRIQSELRIMLWEAPVPFTQVNLSEWQTIMHQRIDQWYDNSPRGDNMTSFEIRVVVGFETKRNTALFNLYRPSPNNPTPSEEQALAMTDVASNMIHIYQNHFRNKHLSIYWQSIENVFNAGTALMVAYSRSPGVREIMTLTSLESLVHTCSSLLWGMVERFPSYQDKRDTFDATATKVLEGLKAETLINKGTFIPGASQHEGALTSSLSAQTHTGSEMPLPAAIAEEQSWLQFLTPGEFDFCHNQEPGAFHDMEVWGLYGDCTLLGQDVSNDDWS